MTKTQKRWQKHVEDCEGSGMSVSEYCRARGISAKSFSYYKSTLSKKRSFVQIPDSTQSSPIVLEVSGVKLHLEGTTPASRIAELVKCLS